MTEKIPKGRGLLVDAVRILVARERPVSWWTRVGDWFSPPLTRYLRDARLKLTVNGMVLLSVPLRYASWDARAREGRLAVDPPLLLEWRDTFHIALERPTLAPASLVVLSYLDGTVTRSRD